MNMRIPFLYLRKAMCTAIAVLAGFNLNAQTAVVGAISGTADVTATGAFTYTVPLSLPPGIRGMIPNLAITYNSQQQAGIMGVGWNISGLSSITRTPSTIHHNAAVDPVDFDGNDVFMLDGQRIMYMGPGLGFIHASYTTTVKNYRQIIGDPNGSFNVETTEGVVFEYGTTGDSRMHASGRSDALIWALSKVRDKS